MHSILNRLATCAVVAAIPCTALAFQSAGDQDARLPVPTTEQQRPLQKIVKELFQPEKATTRAAKIELAGKLMGQVAETNKDPISQFVLLQQSRALAVDAWDFPLACEIVDRTAKMFAIDPHATKLQVLSEATIPTRETDALKSLVNTALASSNAAVAARQFDTANKFGLVAITTARKLRDGKLVREIIEFNKTISARADLERAGEAAVASLKTSSADDPKTKATAGRYLCLIKGAWDQGLPLLAESDDALKQLASQDLAAPKAANDRKSLGDAWLKLAESEKEPWKSGALARAKYWYTQALPDLTGFSQAAVNKKLKDLAEIETIAVEAPQVASTEDEQPKAGKVLELLPLIDPAKHTVGGKWVMDEKGLWIVRTEDKDFARVRVPVMPQGSYELGIEFTKNGGGYLIITLPVGNRSTTLMPGWGNGTVIGKIDNWFAYAKENPTRTDAAPELKVKQRLLVRVEVQGDKAAIRVDLNDKTIIKWSGLVSSLDQGQAESIPAPQSLGIGSHHAGGVYHRVQLKMLTGKAVPVDAKK